jgi:hypothetical protein
MKQVPQDWTRVADRRGLLLLALVPNLYVRKFAAWAMSETTPQGLTLCAAVPQNVARKPAHPKAVAFYRVWCEALYARQIVVKVTEELHGINAERLLVYMQSGSRGLSHKSPPVDRNGRGEKLRRIMRSTNSLRLPDGAEMLMPHENAVLLLDMTGNCAFDAEYA